MNWGKAIVAGIVGGIALWLANFILHGLIMGSTYAKYPIFKLEGNPVYFLLAAVLIAIFAAILFAKTRASWGAGLAGGATFGVFLGLVSFFAHFYHPLTIEGFPYFLAWCWGGIGVIAFAVMGAVMGLVYKRA